MPTRIVHPDGDAPVAAKTLSPRPRSRPSPAAGDGAVVNAKATRKSAKKTGPNWTEDGDYLVGKKRPPKATQWQPGQSGNPQGKIPDTQNMDSIIVALMDKTITITTSHGTEKMTHAAALMRKTYELAVKGNLKATQLLVDLFGGALARKAKGGPQDDALTASEQTMLDALIAGYRAGPASGDGS